MIIKNRMSAAIMALMVLYIFFNFIWFPKRRKVPHVPSGVHSVWGKVHDEVYDLGQDENGNIIRARHGDDDDVCFHYKGILLISYADEDGFATVFFLFVMNQLLYAEKHNLLPWIHLDSSNKHVYDIKEHGPDTTSSGDGIKLGLGVLNGLEWDSFKDEKNGQSYNYPGTPILNYKDDDSVTNEIEIDGTGIWSSYFDPPSRLDPVRHLVNFKESDSSCHKLPIFQLTLKQIEPALMMYSPWAVRAWRRKSTPPALAKWNLPYQQWFDPMRRVAHDMVRKHYSPTEEMTLLAHQANPVVASEDACLALHIRHSDKADRREPIPLEEFKPYVEAYHQEAVWVGTTIVIYVATDSNQVLEQIQKEWPTTLTTYMRYQKGDIVRSNNATAVFDMTSSHHKTNQEVFVDILAMAECEFMIHGMSAVTEAVHYLNLRLHNQSVNLEEETQNSGSYLHRRKSTMSPEQFGSLVRNRLNEKRRASVANQQTMDHGG